jgi:hypothetical protein
MKKIQIKSILTTIAFLTLFISCKRDKDQTAPTACKRLFALQKLLAGKPSSRHPFDTPVPINIADECTQNYQTIYDKKTADFTKIKAAYEHTATFGSDNLIKWLNDISANSNVNQIKIKLAVYNADIVNQFPQLSAKHDKLTVMLYAYHDNDVAVYNQDALKAKTSRFGNPGDPVDPFDLAGLEP